MQEYLPITTYIVVAVIKIAIALFLLLTACAYVVLAERKLIARMQNRWALRVWGRSGSGNHLRTD